MIIRFFNNKKELFQSELFQSARHEIKNMKCYFHPRINRDEDFVAEIFP